MTAYPFRLYRREISLLLLLWLYAVASAQGVEGAGTAQADTPSIYTIQAGDILDISVWKEMDLQKEVLVRPDGGLSFPLIGDIAAEGKSVERLRQEISERLAKYISDPVVTVAVTQILGNRIYVLGKVNKPGDFIVNRYVDVMQALSMAGGMTPFAGRNAIKILRRTNGRQIAIPFRYAEVEKGRNLDQNIILRGGDVVVVP